MMNPVYHRKHPVRPRENGMPGLLRTDDLVRMMEETEYEFLRSRGLSVVMRDQRGVIGFPRMDTEIEICELTGGGEELDIWMALSLNDGVRLRYTFRIERQSLVVARGSYTVACCRFPPGRPPLAILLPQPVRARLPAAPDDCAADGPAENPFRPARPL